VGFFSGLNPLLIRRTSNGKGKNDGRGNSNGSSEGQCWVPSASPQDDGENQAEIKKKQIPRWNDRERNNGKRKGALRLLGE
jgi:hypothetical protein